MVSLAALGCTAEPEGDEQSDLLQESGDAVPVPGPAVRTYADTSVWEVRNNWEDRDTEEANRAGLAWSENSHLNWDEKYALWVLSLEKVKTSDGADKDTFKLTTPEGRIVSAPSMDCADAAIFMRIAFASWYGLPFYMTTQPGSLRYYFGHFGARSRTEALSGFPQYANEYEDYTDTYDGTDWPHDPSLQARALRTAKSADDKEEAEAEEMSFIYDEIYGKEGYHYEGTPNTGAYLDEIFLNKRVGHFISDVLVKLSSASVADSLNTYNLKPTAIRPGDVDVKRKSGSGHVVLVKNVERVNVDGTEGLRAEAASGSIPPRQPYWKDPVTSEVSYFAHSDFGGGDLAKEGGGLKRFRVAKNINGYWTNTWMDGDADEWINSTDYQALGARPQEFRSLLVEINSEEVFDSLVFMVSDARQRLSHYPSSCSARISREDAFSELYKLVSSQSVTKTYIEPSGNKTQVTLTPELVDRIYRLPEDYIFAELDYSASKTCCWNGSSEEMYDVIIAYYEALIEEAEECFAPPVFRAEGGGYAAFEAFAKERGIILNWQPTNDEGCEWFDGVTTDALAKEQPVPWCSFN